MPALAAPAQKRPKRGLIEPAIDGTVPQVYARALDHPPQQVGVTGGVAECIGLAAHQTARASSRALFRQ